MEDEVKYYYDSHQTEKDRMGHPSAHNELVRYLWKVLERLFQGQTFAMYANLNFYQTSDPFEYPEEPDLAIIKGIARQYYARSYRVGKSGPAPQVIFEIASDETWNIDLQEKPVRYAHMRVQEYFAYDPYEPLLPESGKRRLFGWQLDQDTRTMKEMQPRLDGSLWSPNLESWLVPDEVLLRLYDNTGQLRLTPEEDAWRRADAAERLVKALGQRIEDAERLIETARQQTENTIQRREALAEKLRSMGIGPDQILRES